MIFQLQNYNEFKNGVRWHDYVSLVLNEFAVVLVRRYDWPHENDRYLIIAQIFGIQVYSKVGRYAS